MQLCSHKGPVTIQAENPFFPRSSVQATGLSCLTHLLDYFLLSTIRHKCGCPWDTPPPLPPGSPHPPSCLQLWKLALPCPANPEVPLPCLTHLSERPSSTTRLGQKPLFKHHKEYCSSFALCHFCGQFAQVASPKSRSILSYLSVFTSHFPQPAKPPFITFFPWHVQKLSSNWRTR